MKRAMRSSFSQSDALSAVEVRMTELASSM
jgi:hypothetical protein